MAADFDPYYQWLGIPPKDRPCTLYRLLGLENFEPSSDVIDRAADRQTLFLRNYAGGAHASDALQLLNEVASARVRLLNPASKAQYDAELRLRFSGPIAVPLAMPPHLLASPESVVPAPPLSPPRATAPPPIKIIVSPPWTHDKTPQACCGRGGHGL